MRLLSRILGWVLIVAGVLVGEFVVYELWYTDVLTAATQEEARQELNGILEAAPDPVPVSVEVEEEVKDGVSDGEDTAGDDAAGDELSFYPEDWPESGGPIGRIIVPKVDLDVVVFAGVDTATLRDGPGAMPETAFPGQPGNATVSGHRTTYGRPFHNFAELNPGDEIMMETSVGMHTYEVRSVYVVEPDDVWVTDEITGAWLTLTSCHPKFSAAQRLIVQAEMVEGPNAAYARYLSETRPPIPRENDERPIEIIAGEF